MQCNRKKERWFGVLIGIVLLIGLMGAEVRAVPQSKTLSTNFTLVNLAASINPVTIRYYTAGGIECQASQTITLPGPGDQAILRQYDPPLPTSCLTAVVDGTLPLSVVTQILARDGQVATSGAYAGVVQAAPSAYLPLVARKLPSASGQGNSQILVQNASDQAITAEIQLFDGNGQLTYTKSGINLPQYGAFLYDLVSESASNVPDGWFGSAAVRTTTANGQLVALTNLFTGDHTLQTFGGFTTSATEWVAPLFTSRLANSLSTPLVVQNVSGQAIPKDGITVSCKKDANSPGADFTKTNGAAIQNNAAYILNPVTDPTLPEKWFGACRITSTGFATVAFVQMRLINSAQAGAYEAIPATGTGKIVTIPLYAKRLPNGFASAVTIQNLSSSAEAHVKLVYKGAAGTLPSCTLTKENVTIPAGGSLIQNHRVESGPGAVPELGNGCFGTLTVTSSDQPIDAIVQLTDISGQAGDTFMVHNAFTVGSADPIRLPLIGKFQGP